MSIIQSVREYVLKFPELKDGYLRVDYLGSEPVEYTVEAVPCDPVYQQYTDGGCIKQFLFIFASRDFFSADVNRCIENLDFYEKFADWINENDNNEIYPQLDSGKTAVKIEVLTQGYAFDYDEKTARYQIQLRLLYEED